MKESTASQVDDLNVAISKSRENLSKQFAELQKTIETVAAEMRAENNTSLTIQVGHVRLITSMRQINSMIDLDNRRNHFAHTDRAK